ncbi:hypothetical protein [Streptomyces sp. NPDC090022]|uniref:hypothetical protein n=1 Tax=Streptomyces sp. NPDC090022 TaxID=3365920 RepID=UPI003830EB27
MHTGVLDIVTEDAFTLSCTLASADGSEASRPGRAMVDSSRMKPGGMVCGPEDAA